MIVWLTGHTTSGKTWLGDFLEAYHGWKHVEGDKVMFVERDSEITKKVLKAFFEYWLVEKDAPLELWIEYFRGLCEEIYQILKDSPEKNVVVSFSTYPRAVRDFLRSEIKKHTGEELVFVLLEVTVEEYVKRSVARFKDFVKNSGSTIEEVWNENDNMKKLGSYSEENLERFYSESDYTKGLEPLHSNDLNNHTINANENHRYVIPEITRFLKLQEIEDVDVEKVKKLQTDRWTKYLKMVEDKKSPSEGKANIA